MDEEAQLRYAHDTGFDEGYATGYEEGRIDGCSERTCHNVWDVEMTGRLRFECSDCGGVSLEIAPVYCPICGAKVVEE